jgi:hypothetical protein
MQKFSHPSPALVVALVALFVALSGTAFAVGSAVVPLAKRALVADNAKKLNGQTPVALLAQAAKQPGPASSAASLITIKTAAWSLAPRGEGNFTATCDPGQKVIAGGWADPGDWSSGFQSLPTADGTGWTINIFTTSSAPSTQSGSVYAICLK